jgi:hypothetical protein
MELDRFKTAWRQQPLEGAASRSLEETMQVVRERAARFNRGVTVRDLIDTLACLVMIGVVGRYFWVATQILAKIGAGIVVAGCVWIIVRLHLTRARHRRLPADATAREFCANELKRMDEQIHLVSTVVVWGAAPLMVGGAIIVLASGTSAGSLAGRLALVAVPGVLVHLGNRRGLKDRLQPLRDDLARVLSDMSAPKQ